MILRGNWPPFSEVTLSLYNILDKKCNCYGEANYLSYCRSWGFLTYFVFIIHLSQDGYHVSECLKFVNLEYFRFESFIMNHSLMVLRVTLHWILIIINVFLFLIAALIIFSPLGLFFFMLFLISQECNHLINHLRRKFIRRLFNQFTESVDIQFDIVTRYAQIRVFS